MEGTPHKKPLIGSHAKPWLRRKSIIPISDYDLDESFDAAYYKTKKKVPSTLDVILDPNDGVPDYVPIKLTLDKTELNTLLAKFLDEVRKYTLWRELSIGNYYPRTWPALGNYYQIFPPMISILDPHLYRQSTETGAIALTVSPEYIMRCIIKHLSTFPLFNRFDIRLIPKTIRQDLLEPNSDYTLTPLYSATYDRKPGEKLTVPMFKTLERLGEWFAKKDGEFTWHNIFRSYLKDESDVVIKVIGKSLDYCLLIVIFYYYYANEFEKLRQGDLVEYWKYFIPKRQGSVLNNVISLEQTFVYKYSKFNGVDENYNNNYIINYKGNREYLVSLQTGTLPQATLADLVYVSETRPYPPIQKETGSGPTPPIPVIHLPRGKEKHGTKKKTTLHPPPIPVPIPHVFPVPALPLPPAVKTTSTIIPHRKLTRTRDGEKYEMYYIATVYKLAGIISEFKKMVSKMIISQERNIYYDHTFDLAQWNYLADEAITFIKKNMEIERGSELHKLKRKVKACWKYFNQ